jgi:hypothetical protein
VDAVGRLGVEGVEQLNHLAPAAGVAVPALHQQPQGQLLVACLVAAAADFEGDILGRFGRLEGVDANAESVSSRDHHFQMAHT